MAREALLRIEAGDAPGIEGVARASLADSRGGSVNCEVARGGGNPGWPQPTTVIHTNASPIPSARLPFNYAPSHLIYVNCVVDPEYSND